MDESQTPDDGVEALSWQDDYRQKRKQDNTYVLKHFNPKRHVYSFTSLASGPFLWECAWLEFLFPSAALITSIIYDCHFITGPQISSEKKGRRNLENVTEQCWRVRAVLASRAWSWLWELLRAFWAGGWMLGCSITGVHTLDARGILLSIWTANHASRCWQTSHGTDCWEPLLYTNLTD